MNHIAKNEGITVEKITPEQSSHTNSIWFLSLVFVSMVLHALIAYANRPFQTNLLLELSFGAVNFGVVVMMYYGISRAAFSQQFIFLGVAGVTVITLSAVLTKQIPALTIAGGWITVLLTSILCGVLAFRQLALPKVLAVALCAVVLFSSVQLYPLWSKMFGSATDIINLLVADAREVLVSAGYSEATADKFAGQANIIYGAVLRILPALSIMAAMFQFAVAFWLFAGWLNKNGGHKNGFPQFILWKVPFALTPLLLLGVLMRLFGNDLMKLAADNLILLLAIIYSVAGLAMLEFFMKKLRFGGISRFLIYFLFLVTHVIGFTFLALAGFADSFFDWRRKYPLPLNNKTS